jgi:predicted exporter
VVPRSTTNVVAPLDPVHVRSIRVPLLGVAVKPVGGAGAVVAVAKFEYAPFGYTDCTT